MKTIPKLIHQAKHEWYAHRPLVFLWLSLLLAMSLFASPDEPWGLDLLSTLPPLLALLIIGRSVMADLPGNAETRSHTLPLGRSTVFTSKLIFFTVLLLLPWLTLLCWFRTGFEFGASHWSWFLVKCLFTAFGNGLLVAALCSICRTGREKLIAALLACVLLFAISQVPEKRSQALCVTFFVLALGSLFSWWRQCTLQKGAPILFATLIAALFIQVTWTWDWRSLPVPQYTHSPITISSVMKGGSQTLWSGIRLHGLPTDHVASVVQLGQKPSDRSDFWSLDEAGNIRDSVRWMNPAHAQAITHHYPADFLWHGEVDALRKPLPTGMRSYTQDLTLCIHHMRRVCSIPLRQALVGVHHFALQPGLKMKLSRSKNSVYSPVVFDGLLLNRHPDLMPKSPAAGGPQVATNLLIVVSNPDIKEARVAHEGGFGWTMSKDQSLPFTVIPPHPYLDIAGVTTDQWIDGSTLDIWWPEELGIVDLELSAEQVSQWLKP